MSRKTYKFSAAITTQAEDALAKFLKTKDLNLTEKGKILGAAAAFWLPFAMHQQNCSEKELKRYALASIYRLQLHINLIAQSFGVESGVSASIREHRSSKNPEGSALRTEEDLIHDENDETFNQMF